MINGVKLRLFPQKSKVIRIDLFSSYNKLGFQTFFIKLAYGQDKPTFGGYSQVDRSKSVSKLGLRPQRGGRK